jgi:DNA repair exonuclease SbcCD ATPase subunit|tara:strand:- start:3013 stop:4722 length:1710 start_codon:yes stop_codon:yes gene_type:complete
MIVFKNIKWKNFISYGNHWTEVDLNQTKSSLIIGENGSGKSTILDALTFALYNKPFRKVTVQQLVNTINNKDMVVEVEFGIGSHEYKIVRGQKPRKFEVYQNGKLLNQEAHAKDYQETLEKQILKLNHKSFCQVVVLGSSSFIPFMQLPTNHRKEVIEDLLDIGIFSIMATLLKTDVADNKERAQELSSELNTIEEKIRIQQHFVDKISQQQDEAIADKKDQILKLENENSISEIDLKDKEEELAKLRTQVIEEEKIRTKLNQLSNLEDKIKDKVKTLKKDIQFFDTHDDCPTCNQSIDEDFKAKVIDEKEDKVEECEAGFEPLEKELESTQGEINHIVEVYQKIDGMNVQINSLNSQMNGNRQLISSLQTDIDNTSKQDITEEKNKIKDFTIELDSKRKDVEEFTDVREIYDVATKLLRDTGIKSRIVKQYIPVMNKLINKYLAAMDFFVQFELDENFNENIKSRFRDEFTYASFSEGEKMRIDLSLLFTWRAIAKLKNSASTNLLILDEIFDSSLDAQGTDEFLKIINDLTLDTNVFIISHKTDQLIDKFSNVVRFEKHQNFSRMVA